MTSTTEWSQSSDYRQDAGRRPPWAYDALGILAFPRCVIALAMPLVATLPDAPLPAASIFACGAVIVTAPFWQGIMCHVLAEGRR